MALRASYYGLKKRILDKVLGDYDAVGVMTNKELTEKIVPFGSVILSSADDMDAQRPTGIYPFTTEPAHSPENLTYGVLIHIINANTNEQQYVMKGGLGVIYMRSLTSPDPRTWSNWYKFTGTVVS